MGVYFYDQRTFVKHVEMQVKKAKERLAKLYRLMPNIGGPNSTKKQILCSAAPIWYDVFRIKKYKETLSLYHRQILFRVLSGHRIVKAKTLQTVAGGVPIRIIIEGRKIFCDRDYRKAASVKNEERTVTVRKWQRESDATADVPKWTKRPIPDIRLWLKYEHRRGNYFVTQALSGYGCFAVYTKRIGKSNVLWWQWRCLLHSPLLP